MKTIILCGGKGTRIADADYDAKGLVEIGGKPILWHIIKIYAAQGISDFVFTLGHGGDSIKRYFLDYESLNYDFTVMLGEQTHINYHTSSEPLNVSITMADTGLDTNKGGRIAKALQYVDNETFHITYGDGIGNIDISKLIEFHRSHGKLMTVTGYQPFSQYGIMQVNDDNTVTGFEEKPRLSDWINAGFMVCEPGIKELFTDDPNLDLEQDIMVHLARESELKVYRHRGFWRSMDTFKEARELDNMWRNEAPWKVW